jgi:hypothetical protein
MSHRELDRGAAIEMAKRDIAKRLRRVCEDFEEAEFMKLVDRIAEIDVRYRLRDEWTFHGVIGLSHLN